MRRWKVVALLPLLLSAAAGTAVWWFLPTGPNVLLITLDTTRADRLGCYGYRQAKTPFLDRLAAEGVQFDNALTHTPLTLPSHATMLTGLLPPEHGLHTNEMGSLPREIPTLAEHFSARGYRTGAFLGSIVLNKRFGLDRGFAVYDDDLSGGDPGVDESSGRRRRPADRVVDAALSWLLPRRRQPFFCWVHLYDTHEPRSEHAETFGNEFARRNYDAELAFVDQQLERLTSSLREQRLLENTIVVVVGDHGESLGEHTEQAHGMQIYQSTLRVPFLVWFPKRFVGGRQVSTTVGLNDLLPTIADCLAWKIAAPTKVAGRSLLPSLEGQSVEEVPYYCESWEPFFMTHCMPQFGIVSNGWKYIRSPQPELYRISQDAREQTNLVATESGRGAELEVMLKEFESRFVVRKAEDTGKDSRFDEKLRSLGYTGGNSRLPTDSIIGRLRDVKELMVGYQVMCEAIRQPNSQAVIATLERVAGQWPGLHAARRNLASRLISQADLAGDDVEKRKQDLERAENICRELIRAEEDWPEAERSADNYAYLAEVLERTERFDEADKAYERAATLQSSTPALFLEWGLLCLRRNQLERALEKLELAVQFDEGLFKAQFHLGEILVDLANKRSTSNRPEDREEVRRLEAEALRHFKLASRYNRRYLPAHYFAARLLMARQEYAAAAEHYQQIAAIDKQSTEVRYLWALALANQKKYADAVTRLREVLASDPQHAKARKLLRVCEEG